MAGTRRRSSMSSNSVSSTTPQRGTKRKPLSDIDIEKKVKESVSSDADVPLAKRSRVSIDKKSDKFESPTSRTSRRKVKEENVSKQTEDENTDKEEQEGVNIKEESVKVEVEIDDQFNGLSEYERKIQQNVEARAKFMESLDIFSAKENLLELTPKTPKSVKKEYRGIAKEPRSIKPTEVRRSLRQQHMTPDGAHLELPSEKDIAKAAGLAEPESKSRPPPGPAPLLDYYQRHNKEDCETFLRDITDMNVTTKKESVWSGSMASVLKVMKSMKIDDNHVAKVTPQRTFSIQVHPAKDKTLVLIGAKWGELGIWDVERNDESAGAYCYNIHSRPINCLTLHPSTPEDVFTTSYDGTVRKTNLVSGIVNQVYSYCEDHVYNQYISWHAHQDENCLFVASNQGLAVHVDLREPLETVTDYVVHDKSVKVVAVHPTQNNYFATASMDCVCLWDMRNHKKKKPISEVRHARVVSGLEFSPVTGTNLVSTCRDNYLRIISCDLTNLNVTKKISHNNNTGRWLTTFRTRFVPNREDLIVVGSMEQPRRIEVFDTDGSLKHKFMGESFSSVNSVTAMHPTRPILAGSNSSGKAFVFSGEL